MFHADRALVGHGEVEHEYGTLGSTGHKCQPLCHHCLARFLRTKPYGTVLFLFMYNYAAHFALLKRTVYFEH